MKNIIKKLFLFLVVVVLIFTSVGCANRENALEDGEYSGQTVISAPIAQSNWIVNVEIKIENDNITVNDTDLGKLSFVERSARELFDTDLHFSNISEEDGQDLMNELSSLDKYYCAEKSFLPYAPNVYVFVLDGNIYLGLIENGLIKAVFACE